MGVFSFWFHFSPFFLILFFPLSSLFFLSNFLSFLSHSFLQSFGFQIFQMTQLDSFSFSPLSESGRNHHTTQTPSFSYSVRILKGDSPIEFSYSVRILKNNHPFLCTDFELERESPTSFVLHEEER